MTNSFYFKLSLFLCFLPIFSGCVTISAEDITTIPTNITFNNKGEYLLGPNDRIEIKVQGNPTLDGIYAIPPSGVISFPLIGFIATTNLTTAVLSNNLQDKLKTFIKNPLVTVNISAINNYKIFIGGQINHPGSYNFAEKTSVLKAISLAGSETRFATGRIIIVRTDEKGQSKRFATTIRELIQGDAALLELPVEKNDYLYLE